MKDIVRGKAAAASAGIVLALSAPAMAGEWQIVSVNGNAVAGEARVTFNADGTFGGSTGCNRFQGAGRIEAGAMVVSGPLAVTQMACPGDAMTRQDDAIVALFADTLSLAFDPFSETMTLARPDHQIMLAPPGAAVAPEAPPEPAPKPAPEPLALTDATFVNVFGISDRLRIHSAPGADASVVGRVEAGTLLRNKGCQTGSAHDWCNVVFLDASRTEGWAAAEYLEPASAALRAGQRVFDEIGTLTCMETEGGAATECDFGIARDRDGTAVLTVFRADGGERVLTFQNGAFAFADTSEAGGGFDAAAEVDGDLIIVSVGGETYRVRTSLFSRD